MSDPLCSSYSATVKNCKSKELKGGILLSSCDCVKRNGLQDQCSRTGCGKKCIPPNSQKPRCCPSQHTLKFMNLTMGTKKNSMKTKKTCDNNDTNTKNNKTKCSNGKCCIPPKECSNSNDCDQSWHMNNRDVIQLPLETTTSPLGCPFTI